MSLLRLRELGGSLASFASEDLTAWSMARFLFVLAQEDVALAEKASVCDHHVRSRLYIVTRDAMPRNTRNDLEGALFSSVQLVLWPRSEGHSCRMPFPK